MWLCKSKKKKRKKREKRVLKNGQVSKLSKQWVLRYPPEKKKKKIAHVVLQSYFQVLKKRGTFSRSKVELG
jgi:hypothetical protein